MAVLVINQKYKPIGIEFDAFAIQGLTTESHQADSEIFQHPVDRQKQGLTDEVIFQPDRYSASIFISDTPQTYAEQFRNWGKFLTGKDKGETLSESVFKVLKQLRGVLVDIEESYAGTLKSMMVKNVTATREIQKGMRINFEMQEVLFADAVRTEEYISTNTDIVTQTAPKQQKAKPAEEVLTEKEADKSLLTGLTGKGSDASGQAIK